MEVCLSVLSTAAPQPRMNSYRKPEIGRKLVTRGPVFTNVSRCCCFIAGRVIVIIAAGIQITEIRSSKVKTEAAMSFVPCRPCVDVIVICAVQ